MNTLIVEDDFASRALLQANLWPYGRCHVALNGRETIRAFRLAIEKEHPYDLICLDVMMPEVDGQAVLRAIRVMEEAAGIPSGGGAKIVVTFAPMDGAQVFKAFGEMVDGYVMKPVDQAKLLQLAASLGLIGARGIIHRTTP